LPSWYSQMMRCLWALVLPFAGTNVATAQSAPAEPPCGSADHRQFDFWVGEWDVFATGTSKQVATSRIEKLYGGCTIRENWMPTSNPGGGSLNGYDARNRLWQQTWYDSGGARVEFEGGLVAKEMILTGLWRDLLGQGKDALVRMTYSPSADGTVRQLGLQSVDFGKTWQPSFDFTYKPRAK
jgi:hypothetical protein